MRRHRARVNTRSPNRRARKHLRRPCVMKKRARDKHRRRVDLFDALCQQDKHRPTTTADALMELGGRDE